MRTSGISRLATKVSPSTCPVVCVADTWNRGNVVEALTVTAFRVADGGSAWPGEIALAAGISQDAMAGCEA